ncbi:RidA family protein, partial [Campylobacter concisus]|uniref:RidA family protein n=1 Tax=Campylobacter concisus TaxID=199 RepID=UPI0021564F41
TPDIDFWDEIADEYALFFGDHKPARVLVPTNKLHFGCLLEIDATALLDITIQKEQKCLNLSAQSSARAQILRRLYLRASAVGFMIWSLSRPNLL